MIKVHLKSGKFVTSDKQPTLTEADELATGLGQGRCLNFIPGSNGLGFIIPAHAIDFIEYNDK